MQPDPENSQNGDSRENEEISGAENRGAPALGRNQKIAVASLVFFALFVIVLWSIQFKKGLSSPFVYQEGQETNTADTTTCTGPECAAREEAALKRKDTDKDGLSDWDELYAYFTSPYIEDSDSDGLSDKEEVAQNKDPNCPEGRTCVKSTLTNPDATAENNAAANIQSLEGLLEDFNEGDLINAAQKATTTQKAALTETEIQKMMGGQMDAKSLRQMLINEGFNKEALDQISDDQLIATYQESLNSAKSQ